MLDATDEEEEHVDDADDDDDDDDVVSPALPEQTDFVDDSGGAEMGICRCRNCRPFLRATVHLVDMAKNEKIFGSGRITGN